MSGEPVKIGSENNSIQVHPHGATLIQWKPGGEDVIFLSSKAILDGSKAIRGGIPICFPQFGPWELGPQHGFARNSTWASGSKAGEFILKSNEETLKVWPYPFHCRYLTALQGDNKLTLRMEVQNTGEKDFDFTLCIHSYFKVPDVTQCSIEGLTSLEYIDKVKGGSVEKETRESVTVKEFTDRVYKNSPKEIILRGLKGGKSLKITQNNLKDTVVWNPWAENAKKMSDFGDDEYTGMICVEPATASERVVVKAGESYVGEVHLEVF